MTTNKTKKRLLLIMLVILLSGVGIGLVLHRLSAPAIRHVVLISVDTCRADHLSCYGYARPTTPHIDALAGQGYLFSHAVTPIPLTLPAHTSMLTGTIPPHHGKHENKDPYFDPSHVTLAQLLKKKGYRTGAFVGSQILNGSFGLDRGFDTYDDRFEQEEESERRAEEVNRAAFAWLEQQKRKPVFLFLHYYDPHDDYDPPEPFATTFKGSPYAGEIAYTDHCIGEVFAKLKSLDMYDSSLIIVTADHGEMLGEHGEAGHMYFIYQSAMKVPLIWKLPGSSSAQRIDGITGIVDIVPTVCDLAGIDPPAGIQGKNLAAYFSNTAPESEERYLYCESLYPTKYEANSLLGLIGKRWKYIQTTRPELYDLQDDPGEQKNLVETHPHRARILKHRLAQVLEQTARQEEGQEDAPLSAEALKHLLSLGYVGGSSVKEDYSFDQSKKDPKDLIGFHEEFRKVSRLMVQNEPVDIRAVGEALIKQWPEFFESYNLLVGVAVRQKDYRSAIHYGEKALELKPDVFDVHQILGFAYSQIGQNEAAARHFELALKCVPEDQPDSRAQRMQVHNQLGLLHSKQKKFDLAIVQYEETLKLNPEQPDMLNALAQALLACRNPALRNPPRALKLAQKACRLTQSKNPEYLSTLGVAYATLNNLSEAIKILEKALPLAQARSDQVLLNKLNTQLGLIRRAMAESKTKTAR
ncbi:MAG: sulfatase-like hydrolase/transferase [Planctomycetota bacterium]|jgi:arylsulfatase A-like enzyme/Flp pilus assembly protein TadD